MKDLAKLNKRKAKETITAEEDSSPEATIKCGVDSGHENKTERVKDCDLLPPKHRCTVLACIGFEGVQSPTSCNTLKIKMVL